MVELVVPEGELVVAVVGSRAWPDPGRVRAWVEALAAKHPRAIVASGGAPGADFEAERAAGGAGLRVVSLRPRAAIVTEGLPSAPRAPQGVPEDAPWDHPSLVAWRDRDRALAERTRQLLDSWRVVVVERRPGEREAEHVLPELHPSRAAANHARNGMLARLAGEVVAFHHRGSPGTASTLAAARALGKEPLVFES